MLVISTSVASCFNSSRLASTIISPLIPLPSIPSSVEETELFPSTMIDGSFFSISQIQYKDESIYDAKKVQSMPVVPVFFLMNGKPMECILRKQIQVCIFLRQSYLYWLLCLSVFSYVLCRCWAPIAPLETYYFVVKERTNIVCMVIRYYMHYNEL